MQHEQYGNDQRRAQERNRKTAARSFNADFKHFVVPSWLRRRWRPRRNGETHADLPWRNLTRVRSPGHRQVDMVPDHQNRTRRSQGRNAADRSPHTGATDGAGHGLYRSVRRVGAGRRSASGHARCNRSTAGPRRPGHSSGQLVEAIQRRHLFFAMPSPGSSDPQPRRQTPEPRPRTSWTLHSSSAARCSRCLWSESEYSWSFGLLRQEGVVTVREVAQPVRRPSWARAGPAIARRADRLGRG